MLSSSDPNPTIHSIPRDSKYRTSNWVPPCLQKMESIRSNSHGVGWKEAPLFKFQCATSQNIKSGNCDEDIVHHKLAMPNQRAQATGRLLHLPPTNLSHTHTLRLTILTLVDSNHEIDKEERKRRESTITWVCNSTDRHHPEAKLEQQDEECCCSAGLGPPHPTHLGVVIHTSQHRNAPQCCKSLPTLASRCSNSPPSSFSYLKSRQASYPRDSTPDEPRPAFNPKKTTIHTRNTNLLRTKKNKTRVSCNRFKIRTQ